MSDEEVKLVTVYCEGLGTEEVEINQILNHLASTNTFRQPVKITSLNPAFSAEISYTDDGDDIVFCDVTCWCRGSQCFLKKRQLYPEDYETEAEYQWRISEEERKFGWHR